MTYQYLIKRLLPFSLGFIAAVFVTSLFQALGSIGQTANVPEVPVASSGSSYSCKYKMRGIGKGYGAGYGTGSGISRRPESDLKLLHKPAPEYTAEARANNTEGTVRLRVMFLESGEIGAITPLNILGDGLTEQAIEAAREIRFEPATRNGTPVTTTKTIEYTFTSY